MTATQGVLVCAAILLIVAVLTALAAVWGRSRERRREENLAVRRARAARNARLADAEEQQQYGRRWPV